LKLKHLIGFEPNCGPSALHSSPTCGLVFGGSNTDAVSDVYHNAISVYTKYQL